mmetsp:Transcript_80842/g.127735  ORF Transcript_80842/g.127735 Transcript_80842/m.127735 type:complete len:89 (+) Transcript_80842:586-852(+)
MPSHSDFGSLPSGTTQGAPTSAEHSRFDWRMFAKQQFSLPPANREQMGPPQVWHLLGQHTLLDCSPARHLLEDAISNFWDWSDWMLVT